MTTTLMPGRPPATAVGDLATAYALTSRLFLAPADAALLTTLAESELLAGWPLQCCEETVRGLAALRRSLAEGEDRADLAEDYQQLFVTREACLPAPRESAYRPFEHLLTDLPGDHLGAELGHAGQLCLAAAEAAGRGDEASAGRHLAAHRDFLAEHLLRWAPGCLRETEADAATHFYRGAAALALGVLAHAHGQLR